MNSIFKALVLGSLITGSALPAFSQTPFQAGLNFLVGVPQGEFADNVSDPGFGFSGHFGYTIPRSVFAIGANLGFLVYGSETRKEPFSETIPDVTVDVSRTNSIFQGHLMFRIQPVNGFLAPYIDGLFGFNYLFTETSVKNEDSFNGYDEIASSTNYDDIAFSYGGGGGMMLRVYSGMHENDETGEEKPFQVFIDLGMRYLLGGEAEYLTKGSITITEDSRVLYSPSKSKTDLLNFHIGASVAF